MDDPEGDFAEPVEFSCDGDFELLLEGARRAHNSELELMRAQLEMLRLKLDQANTSIAALGGVVPQGTDGDKPRQKMLASSATSHGQEVNNQDSAGTSRNQGKSEHFVMKTLSSATSKMKGATSKKSMQRGLSQSGMAEENRLKKALEAEISIFQKVVMHPSFEVFFAILIVVNGILMAVEAQYKGFELGVATGFLSDGDAEGIWPHAETAFEVCGWIFGVLFCLEITAKLIALRRKFFVDFWNIIDLGVVLTWLTGRILGGQTINAQILRLARLARLLRLTRLIRSMRQQSFDALYLMTTALKGSISILTWALILMIVIHVLLALLLNQFLTEVFFNGVEASPGAAEVYKYFGNFSRSLLTMFEITLANWPTSCRILTENSSQWFIIYFLLHKMVLGFAVVGVVNAVFIQETFKVATLDDTVMVRQTRRRQKFHNEKMKRLFAQADANGDGKVDLAEWKQVCEDDWVQVWLTSQELNAQDAVTLFRMLDNGDGNLSAHELVVGASRLKGQASNMDVKIILRNVARLLKDLQREFDQKFNTSTIEQGGVGMGGELEAI